MSSLKLECLLLKSTLFYFYFHTRLAPAFGYRIWIKLDLSENCLQACVLCVCVGGGGYQSYPMNLYSRDAVHTFVTTD